MGDVTALCALPPQVLKLPSNSGDGARTQVTGVSGEPDTLLAGIGGSVHLYDPFKREGDPLLFVCAVFNAERIHGIVPVADFDPFCSHSNVDSRHGGLNVPETRALLVYGERRVTIAALCVTEKEQGHLRKVANLPLLGHWVHDVLPLQRDTSHFSHPVVAVGLADNSVEQWLMPTYQAGTNVKDCAPQCLRRVECVKRSMLYSLALRGASINDLEVAAGTIFNQIQLWAPRDAKDCRAGELGILDSRRPLPWAVLNGHSGSIMRVCWAHDGASVFSTSDDRTARVWIVPARRILTSPVVFPGNGIQSFGGNLSLRGHMGRVWDCHMVTMETSTILVTAGEDCTVRLWVSPPGFLKGEKHQQSKDDGCVGQPAEIYLDEPIAVLRGHKGRGVWRVISMHSPLGGRALVTAGADASIKLWDLREFCLSVERESHTSHGISASGIQNNHCFKLFEGPILPLSCYDIDAETKSDVNGKLRCSSGVNATQTKHAPRNSKGHRGDSKGEYVRVIYISKPSIVHVATNKGVLYRVEVLEGAKNTWCWREIYRIDPCGPIVALTHVKCGSSAVSDTANNLNHCAIVLGDIHGQVSVLFIDGSVDRVANQRCRGYSTRVMQTWHACEPRRLLDLFRESGDNINHRPEYLFTSEVGGVIKWWKRQQVSHAWHDDASHGSKWTFAGVAPMPFGQRVLAVSYHQASRVMLCGDQAGNIAAFDGPGMNNHKSKYKTLVSLNTANLPILAASCKANSASSVTFAEIRDAINFHFETDHADQIRALKFYTGGRDGCLRTFILRQVLPSSSTKLEQTSFINGSIQLSNESRRFSLSNLDNFQGENVLNRSSISHGQIYLRTAIRPREETLSTIHSNVGSTPYQFLCLAKRRFPNISTMRALKWSVDVGFDPGKKDAMGESLSIVAGFKNTEFIVIDASTNCELLRVHCGGWHRPISLLIGEGDCSGISFAFCQGAKLTLLERLPWNITYRDPAAKYNLRNLSGSSHG